MTLRMHLLVGLSHWTLTGQNIYVTETDNLHTQVTQHKYTSKTTHKQYKTVQNSQKTIPIVKLKYYLPVLVLKSGSQT